MEEKIFDQLGYANQNLSFTVLEKKLKETVGIRKLTVDILKVLGLYSDEEGYNNAAGLLADHNRFSGIEIVRYGKQTNIVKEQVSAAGVSMLSQYEQALMMYQRYYQEEVIEKILREKRELVPETAFQKAVLYAITHHDWRDQSNIQIAMYDNCINIAFTGSSSFSYHPVLTSVLFHMHAIDSFDKDFQRIRVTYKNRKQIPVFESKDQMIQIILPVIDEHPDLTFTESKVYQSLDNHQLVSSSELVSSTGLSKATVIRALNVLSNRYLVVKTGQARRTRYQI
ncbi:hypothetical protein MOZ60_06265 [Stecheria sp. CLA-KB-P133]|uniref:Uncharacterized protein n=1 Tax=Grylomicrobium aquisgranensis TaxID=2926318 RepID=A0AB35U4C4_9FIRM|nr:hypothetical protein [Stecheria sp. CLA-KB-P133]